MAKVDSLKRISEYVGLIREKGTTIVGLGVTAFNRIGPALFYPDFQLVCYKDGSDIEALKKYCLIKSIQRDFIEYGDLRKWNSCDILRHKGVQKYLKSLGDAYLFVYKLTKRTARLTDNLGVKVLANRPELRDQYEDKKKFFNIGREIGLPMIPGKQCEINQLDKLGYKRLIKEIGDRLVFQLTDISLGGGKGTFFVNSLDDFMMFRSIVEKMRQQRKLEHVNVTKFIVGASPSITGCVTKHGVLTGIVQTQVVDVPELSSGNTRGVFQGHDWSYCFYDVKIQRQADKIAKTLGEYMFRRGYKGIFGVDLVIDSETEKVYPVECNPRYTAAFPVYSMLQYVYNELPLDVFHFMEFLDIDYAMDFEQIDRQWKQKKEGAHLVLANKDKENWLEVIKAMSAGVYRLKGDKCLRLRDGSTYMDIKKEGEFVYTDGCPRKGQLIKPGLRFGRLIFRDKVLEEPGVLNNFARCAVGSVVNGFSFSVKDK